MCRQKHLTVQLDVYGNCHSNFPSFFDDSVCKGSIFVPNTKVAIAFFSPGNKKLIYISSYTCLYCILYIIILWSTCVHGVAHRWSFLSKDIKTVRCMQKVVAGVVLVLLGPPLKTPWLVIRAVRFVFITGYYRYCGSCCPGKPLDAPSFLGNLAGIGKDRCGAKGYTVNTGSGSNRS